MTSVYRIHGIELSPYSVKVRSYFRYKGISHRWIPRSLDADGEYQKYSKLPLVPLVVTPENEGIQDFNADHRASRGSSSGAVNSSERSGHKVHFGAARGVRRRMGQ